MANILTAVPEAAVLLAVGKVLISGTGKAPLRA
jgi:hypothetical protein